MNITQLQKIVVDALEDIKGRDIEVINTSKLTPLSVSYTHLRAHETVLDLVCRLLLAKQQAHDTALDIVCRLLLAKKKKTHNLN